MICEALSDIRGTPRNAAILLYMSIKACNGGISLPPIAFAISITDSCAVLNAISTPCIMLRTTPKALTIAPATF